MTTTVETRNRARRIERVLKRIYPEARCSLDFANPFQLLVATILSAQCTDARVNLVTPALFSRYPDAASLATAEQAEVEQLVRSTGFYQNKAKNLIRCASQLVETHAGEVPRDMEKLVQLAGVGRKTANVIRGVAFGIPGLPVDTHVTRLSRRMGLTTHHDAVRIESDLNVLIPQSKWTTFGLRMIFHGRQVCDARKPDCHACPLLPKLCPRIGVSH
ncbi:MAG: endonuclease III [Planctomycetia bacterium]|nr:endonuclease III [Planctomycetia bacterium]